MKYLILVMILVGCGKPLTNSNPSNSSSAEAQARKGAGNCQVKVTFGLSYQEIAVRANALRVNCNLSEVQVLNLFDT